MPDSKTKVIGVSLPVDKAAELERRSAQLNLSVSRFCCIVLCEWMERGETLTLTEEG